MLLNTKALCREVSTEECLFCHYSEIPEGEQPPFPICSNHIVIVQFILNKAEIPYQTEYRIEEDI